MPFTNRLDTKSSHPHNHQSLHYDAIIVGASVAGCIGALELANRGWRVAVIEKQTSASHYKKICTHIIHPSAVNKLRNAGVFDELTEQGAQMTCMKITHNGKTVHYPLAGKLAAANIERQNLDPALKNAVLKQSNIELMVGYRLLSLLKDNKRVNGVVVKDPEQVELCLHAALVIGADGRQSTTVKLAGGKTHSLSNERVAIFSYFETDTHLAESKVWAFDNGLQYMGYFPNNKRTLLSWYLPRAQYLSQKTTGDHSINTLINFLAEQGITVGERQESIMVAKNTASQTCRVNLKGIALIGDAKLSPDPLTGIGCQWAIHSAGLLANCLGRAPADTTPKALTDARIRMGITLYNLIHALRFRLPSRIMSAISNHGSVVFNKPIYSILAWLTRAKHVGSRD